MQQGATILQFPVARSEISGPSRLMSALEDLQAALEEQQRVLREWRFALAELGIGVACLGHSLVVYQDNLGDVAGRLDTLRDRSADMAAWADRELQH